MHADGAGTKSSLAYMYWRKPATWVCGLGFTDHSAAHCTMVAKRAAYILKKFGYSESDIEMVKIAGFMHDIGNVVNRSRHAEYGAILANEVLKETDMSLKDRITVVSAIGHHDESTGGATDPISAALIIADKTDVRRNRVRNKAKEILIYTTG